MDLTIEQRVAKGVEYMDTYGPADWRDRIDLEILDIDSFQHCILGQVFGGFNAHYYDFLSNVGEDGHADEYGFACEIWEDMALTSEWIRVLSLPANEQEEC